MNEELYGPIKGYCRNCHSQQLAYYVGMMGYEAIVCDDCGTHHSNAEPISSFIPAWSKKNIAFPDCYKSCGAAEYLGVGECESICPWKFDKDGNSINFLTEKGEKP